MSPLPLKAEIIKIPLADGGDGMLRIIVEAKGGKTYKKQVTGPLGTPIDAEYGILLDNTVVIELAKISGLSLLPKELRTPTKTTTYGVGEMIKIAIQGGVKKILIGVGGSATCDGGAGILAALGIKFVNKEGKCFIPVGGTLNLIKEVGVIHKLPLPEIVVLSDVTNPLLGTDGTAKVYAPQKGASEKQVELLEQGLTHFCNLMGGENIAQKTGMGAGGGVPFGLSLIGAKIVMGTKFIMELVNFETKARDANLIITGEGEISENTKYGKVVWEVIQFGKSHQIPVMIIVGNIKKGVNNCYIQGRNKIFSLTNDKISQEYSISHTPELLQTTAEKIGKLLQGERSRDLVSTP